MGARLVKEGDLLWEPSKEFRQSSNMSRYLSWVNKEYGKNFSNYSELWEWSVNNLEDFWASMWKFFDIKASKPYTTVLGDRKMPGTKWFAGAELNYAEHIFRNASKDRPAILHQSELRPLGEVSWDELYRQTASMSAALRSLGVGRGDRVVAYVSNIPEAVVALLATASLGAIWSSCSPDFGDRSVIDRFRQIEPKVLFAVDGYQYGGKPFDRVQTVRDIQEALPTLQKTIFIPYLKPDAAPAGLKNVVLWKDLLGGPKELVCEQVPFDHPLWVVYSSGTTGLPKPMVHGHGGVVLEHLKLMALHMDLKPSDRFFWFTTTGWVMWNLVVAGLLTGTAIGIYDGNPGYPDSNLLWDIGEKIGATVLGMSPAYIAGCMKAGLEPGKSHDLSRVRTMGTTGSPLPPEAYQWLYEKAKKDLWLTSISGGTDVASAFVGSAPLLPVHAGEMQCRCLGVKVEAFSERGEPLVDEVGELVVTEPMPSMPLFFWNDKDNRRYLDSYFDMYPGVWRHGDWLKVTKRGTAIISGRSDSTLNRMGVRLGSSEIYSAVEELPEVVDSLIIGYEKEGGGYHMPLFVVLREGFVLDESLKAKIGHKLRTTLSPRHVPDDVFAIREVPRTLNGKKLEVPVKRLLQGVPVEKAVNLDSMANRESIGYFVELQKDLAARG